MKYLIEFSGDITVPAKTEDEALDKVNAMLEDLGVDVKTIHGVRR